MRRRLTARLPIRDQVQEEPQESLRRPPVGVAQVSDGLCRVVHQVRLRRHALRGRRPAAVSPPALRCSAKFMKKIVYITRLEELTPHMRLDQLDIPADVLRADPPGPKGKVRRPSRPVGGAVLTRRARTRRTRPRPAPCWKSRPSRASTASRYRYVTLPARMRPQHALNIARWSRRHWPKDGYRMPCSCPSSRFGAKVWPQHVQRLCDPDPTPLTVR